MARKGANGLSIEVIVGIVLVLAIILIVATGVWQKYSFFISVAKLIPGFNYTESTVGMTTIGINLDKNNELQYFTGKRWKKVDMQNGNFVLGNYELNPVEVKKALEDFYFRTPRKPEIFMEEINDWRYIEATISDKGNVSVKFKTKTGFFGDTLTDYYSIDFNGQIKPTGSTDNSAGEYYAPSFSKIEINRDPQIAQRVVDWRDSILKGNKCERFINLNLNENKKGFNSTQYSVRKLDNYLFVDLSANNEGQSENYKDGCNTLESFEVSKNTVKKPINVYFIDTFLGRTLYFTFDPIAGWSVTPDTKYTEGWLFKEEKERYILESNSILYGNIKYSFISGLYSIFSTGSGHVSSRVQFYLGTAQNADIIHEMEGIDSEDLSKLDELLYNKILTPYNSKILVEPSNA